VSGIEVPQPDVDSAPFWEAVGQHRLVVQQCDDCRGLRFPTLPVCPRCGSMKTSWADVSGRGRVLSWVVTHQVFHPAFAARVPYTILLVQLDEQHGLLMYGNLRPEGAEVTPGMAVDAVFEDAEGFTLVQWTPGSAST
jgi:uncharacterized OB-fold protein